MSTLAELEKLVRDLAARLKKLEKRKELEPLVYTFDETVEALSVPPRTMSDLVHREDFPAFKIGGKWKISRELLAAWVRVQAGGEALPAAEPEGSDPGYSLDDAAYVLCVSRPVMYELLKQEGFPPSLPAGSKRLIPREQLREWVSAQVRKGGAG